MAGGYTQIVHNNFADFFGNDRPKLDLISANNRQFEIWPKWTILTSDSFKTNKFKYIYELVNVNKMIKYSLDNIN